MIRGADFRAMHHEMRRGLRGIASVFQFCQREVRDFNAIVSRRPDERSAADCVIAITAT